MQTRQELCVLPRKGRSDELCLPNDGADLTLLDGALEGLPCEETSVIPALQRAQGVYGYLPKSVIGELANRLGVPWARVYGVATFYAQFHLEPRGKHIIRVCRGTACHVAGVSAIIQAIEQALGITDNETTEDRLFTLQTVACLGTCSLAPVMLVDETYYGRLTVSDVPRILESYHGEE